MTDPRRPLGIVVVSYGSSALLAQHLAAVDRDALGPHAVVVVENHPSPAASDATAALAAAQGWELVRPGTNIGFGAGCNRGVARAAGAGCATFLLLNPDVTIDATTIEALRSATATRPRSLLSPRLLWPDGTVWFAGSELDRRTGFTRSRPEQRGADRDQWLTATCLVVDEDCWDALGGFDERYFLYWEDIDLCHRARALGCGISVLHELTAVHHVGSTQRPSGSPHAKSPTYAYHMCRNRLRFAATHLGRRDRIRWLCHAPRYAAVVARRDGGRAALRRPAMPAAAVAGTVTGASTVVRSLVRTGSPTGT
jgi:N-acetylglucosaminyl-diphospho-decaprenol L-rhamnosyltransferase